MNGDDPKKEVDELLSELKSAAKSYTVDDIKSGNWFVRFLHYSLETYAKKVNAEYFRHKYPGLPPDVIVERQIDLAKKYSMIEGGLSAGAYSAAVATTLGSGGGSSPLTLPAALTSFAVDLTFTTQLQLRLAFDMAILYGVPVSLEDPEDLYDLIKVAFGIKAGELAQEATMKLTPEAVRQLVKGVVKGPVLEFLRAVPVIGKYLLQRNIAKFAIPFINVPVTMGMNYFFTRAIGNRARQIFRSRAVIHEQATKLVESLEDHPSLLVRTLWFVIQADGKQAEGETILLREVGKHFAEHGHADDVLRDLESTITLDCEQLFDEIKALPEDARNHLLRAAVVAAAADGKLHPNELQALELLATRCEVNFYAHDVERTIKDMSPS